MKLMVAMAALCLVITQAGTPSAPSPAGDDEACQFIAQAIEATKSLKAGMTRSELDKNFTEDGGITFIGQGQHHARYVYRKCPYIKIDVDLTVAGVDEKPAMSPTDRILKVSRPYLEHPFYD